MSVSTIQELFIDELRDIYHAEKQLLKALPKMAKAAAHPQLRRQQPKDSWCLDFTVPLIGRG